LIAVSVYKGYADYPLIILIDLLSAAIGFIYAKGMLAAGK
jgi:general stress protein CsbA